MPRALITGANRGIGLELARQYATDDWNVLACCRHASDALKKLDNVKIFHLDVTNHSAIEDLADELVGVEIDVLINNAGVNGQASIADRGPKTQAFGNIDYDHWVQVLQINMIAPLKISESFVEHVAASKQKKIITISSHLGSIKENVSGGFYLYRSSKSGVNAVMKSMSVDLLERGVLATAIHPGWVMTELGGPNADIDVTTCVKGIRGVIAGLTSDQLGHVIAYNGEYIPY